MGGYLRLYHVNRQFEAKLIYSHIRRGCKLDGKRALLISLLSPTKMSATPTMLGSIGEWEAGGEEREDEEEHEEELGEEEAEEEELGRGVIVVFPYRIIV